jgi:hypothetical protein
MFELPHDLFQEPSGDVEIVCHRGDRNRAFGGVARQVEQGEHSILAFCGYFEHGQIPTDLLGIRPI